MEDELLLDTAQRAIKILEMLIEGFRDGSYIELPVAIVMKPDETYTVVEGSCHNKYTIMGMLLDCAIDRRE